VSNGEYVVPGFLANGISAGIKEKGVKDLALIRLLDPHNGENP